MKPTTPPLATPPTEIDPHTILVIAGHARRDPRAVRRYLAGERVRPIVAADVTRALVALGLATLEHAG